MKTRESWIDVAKGLGILLVVFGHSALPEQNESLIYVYWFHMPAFFVISGYLYKDVLAWSDLVAATKKRAIQLIVPYASFFILFALHKLITSVIEGNINIAVFMKEAVRDAFGGRFAGSYYTVFWFITCLFATQLLFSVIRLVKSTYIQLAIILLCYVLAHAEVWLLNLNNLSATDVKIPWNLDVAFISIAYFSLGFYTKTFLKKIPIPVIVASIFLSAAFIALNKIGIFNYKLDLKPLYYKDLLLDLIIPSVMTLALFGISQLLSKIGFFVRVLGALGVVSLVIMYLHYPMNMVLLEQVEYGSFMFILIGTVPAFILTKLVLERFVVTQFLFLGIHKPHRKNNTVELTKEITTAPELH